MSLVSNLFLISLYFGVIGIFASTTSIALHHTFMLVAIVIFFLKRIDTSFSFKSFFCSRSSIFLWMFSLSIVLSVVANISEIDKPLKWIFKFKYFIFPLLCLPLLKHLEISLEKWRYFIYFSLFVLFLANLSGFWGYEYGYNFLKPSGSSSPHRLSGLNGMVLTYAHNLSFFNILLLGYLIYFKDLSKKIPLNINVCIFMFLMNCICLYLSSTRGAWLSFVFSIPFLYLFRLSFKKWILLFVATLIVFVGSLKLSNMDKEFIGHKRANSNTQRIAFFISAIKSFSEKPIFGLGYKQFEFNVLDIKKRHQIEWDNQSGHAHNNFLEHLASLGFFGAIAFVLFSLYWFFESTHLRSSQRFLVQGFCAAVAISGLTQYTFGDGENTVFMMLVWLYTAREILKGRNKSGGTSWIRTGDRPVMSREL